MNQTNNFQQISINNHGIAASIAIDNSKSLEGKIPKAHSIRVNDRLDSRLIPIDVADSEARPVLVRVSNIRRKAEV